MFFAADKLFLYKQLHTYLLIKKKSFKSIVKDLTIN